MYSNFERPLPLGVNRIRGAAVHESMLKEHLFPNQSDQNRAILPEIPEDSTRDASHQR